MNRSIQPAASSSRGHRRRARRTWRRSADAGAALLLGAVGFFATGTPIAGAADVTAGDCTTLASALGAGGTVQLGGDIGTTTACTGMSVGSGVNATLDLNGHTLTIVGTPGADGANEVAAQLPPPFGTGAPAVPATPGAAGQVGLTIPATSSLSVTGGGQLNITGGVGGDGGAGIGLTAAPGGVGGAGIGGAGSLDVLSGDVEFTGGAGGTSGQAPNGMTGTSAQAGGDGVEGLSTLTVTSPATFTAEGGTGGTGGWGGSGTSSPGTDGTPNGQEAGAGGPGGAGIASVGAVTQESGVLSVIGGDGGTGGWGGGVMGPALPPEKGIGGRGGSGGRAGAGLGAGTVVSPTGTFAVRAGTPGSGGRGGVCSGACTTGPVGSVGPSSVGIANGAAVSVTNAATWSVADGDLVDNAGTIDVAAGARIDLDGTLKGTGTVSNLGTIALGPNGSVDPGLAISGHNYALSFATARGAVAPNSLAVYAATPADAGLAFPTPTGTGTEDFVAWQAQGGPLADQPVTATTDLSVGGTQMATGAPIAVALRAGFSQTITFTSTAPTDAKVGGTYEVSATGGGSGNPVTFSIAAGSTGCTVASATVSFTGVGTCVITADQAGGPDYTPAPSVQQSFTISPPADQGATVYGTVTEAGSGTLLANVCATLWDGPSQLRTTCSAADGTWLMGDVAPGTYTMSFVDATGVHTTQWAGGATTQATSQAVVVAPGAAIAQNAAMGTQTGTISGTVHHSPDHPTRYECVYLYHPGANGAYAGVATCTNPTGQYVLSGMAPGSYVVAFADPLGLTPTLWSGGATTQAAATSVTVDGSTGTTNIDVTPSLAADVIAGQVTDANGVGLANICVYAFQTDSTTRTAGSSALAATCTNAQGGYVLAGLPAWGTAEYQVAFVDPTGAHPTQWASPVTRANAARIGANYWAAPRFVWGVSMRNGTTQYVSLRLHDGGSISGTVTDVATGAPRVGACVYVNYAPDGAYVGVGAVTDAQGHYRIDNLAPTRDATVPGSPGYRVGFYADCTPGQPPTENWNGGASFEAAAPSIDVSVASDTAGIDATF